MDKEKLGKPGCGGCHPGGGLGEFDRDGQRYDKRLRANPSLAESLDGDYYQSKWDKSGVVEADCLFCHLPGFNSEKRNKQLKMLNYKWATVAGSGIGQVAGFVRNGQKPEVTYNRRFFNENGHIALNLQRPAAENCNLCHSWIDMAKRGTKWEDKNYMDVHKLAGMTCIDCHFGDLDHNFAKGDESVSNVRDDLDNTMRSCEECHSSGYKGAPEPEHTTIRKDHLDKIGCVTCHIPKLDRSAIGAMAINTGPPVKYPQWKTDKIGAAIDWRPSYELRKKGKDRLAKIWPVNRIIPLMYTNQDKDGIYYPLFVREIKKAFEKCKGKLSDKKNKLDIHTDEDISTILAALTFTLSDNQRFSLVKPYYHKGRFKYSINPDASLKKEVDDSWVAEMEPFSISHNVGLPRDALGAGGCNDCHARGAHLFEGRIITDIFGPDGKPVTEASGHFIGFNTWTFQLNYLFHRYLTVIMPILMTVLGLLIVSLILRYIGHMKKNADSQNSIAASPFGWTDFWANILKLIALLLIVAVAHIMIFAEAGMLGVFISLYKKAMVFAGEIGIVFFIAAVGFYLLILRSRPARFQDMVHQRAFQIANICAVFMGITGATLMMKEQWSANANMFLSCLHGVVSVCFLGFVIIYLYKNITLALQQDKE